VLARDHALRYDDGELAVVARWTADGY